SPPRQLASAPSCNCPSQCCRLGHQRRRRAGPVEGFLMRCLRWVRTRTQVCVMDVLHYLTDASPPELAQTVVAVVPALVDDLDAHVRGYATFLRTRLQRSGRVNVSFGVAPAPWPYVGGLRPSHRPVPGRALREPG